MADDDEQAAEATPELDRTRADGPTPPRPREIDGDRTRREGPSAETPPRHAGDARNLGTDDTALQQLEAQVREKLFGDSSPAPMRMGRFVLLEKLGQGGMGAVHAAYDEQLDRKVAIKVLRTDYEGDDEHRLRLQREAQAMARLSHPNVATVHEVGRSGGALFVAMEFIRGRDLEDWLSTEPPWLEVVEAFGQAGRGLLAAHRAGLVHRDFKPHNAMRTDDGVVKVLDFGLARATGDSPATMTSSDGSKSGASLTSTLTVAGSVMGTPAYMAPEQHRGEPTDARTDQYAFCIALWRGLVGRRPFVAKTLHGLLETKIEGPDPWPDDAPPVPKSVVDALRRGLSPKPDDRFPDMEPLLQILSQGPGRGRNRWVFGALGIGVVGLGGWLLSGELERRGQRCTGAAEQLQGIWDQTRRDRVEQAFAALTESYAPLAWERTERELTAYADDWVAAHTQACEASTVRGEQSAAVMDLRMTCLHRAAMGLRAVVDTLADADAEVASKSHELVAGLAPLSRCSDIEALSTAVEPPLPGEAEAVDQAAQELADAEVLIRTGRYPAAQSAIESAKERLTDVTYGPIRTELALLEGRLHEDRGEYDAARSRLDDGLELAVRNKQWDLLPRLALASMTVAGTRQQRTEEALRYRPLIQGASDESPEIERRLHLEVATSLYFQGKYEEAQTEAQTALELRLQALGPEHLETADARGVVGSILLALGRAEEAEAEIREALSVQSEQLGEGHPVLSHGHNNLAAILMQQGKIEEAERELRIALSISIEVLGPEHPDVAVTHSNLGIVLSELDRHEEAVDEYRAAVSIRVAAMGADDPEVATFRSALASSLMDLGKLDEADVEIVEAVRVGVASLGADHPKVATYRNNLAFLRKTQGRLDEAAAEFRAAAEIQTKAVGPDHFNVSDYRRNLGLVLHLQGKYEEAEAELREAIRVCIVGYSPKDPRMAPMHIELAEVLVARGKLEEAEAEYRSSMVLSSEVADPYGLRPACTARIGLAETLVALDRRLDALAVAEEALTVCEEEKAGAEKRSRAAFVLARVLWSIDGSARDRTRAVRLAQDALRLSREAGEGDAPSEQLLEIERWLESRRAAP